MMYEVTSAEASKLLRAEQDILDDLLLKDSQSNNFNAAINEDVDSVRPEYDYEAVRREIVDRSERIRYIKHAINVFNTTHVVGDTNMTVDEVLVYIPQLSRMKVRLAKMQSRLPKTRVAAYGMGSNAVIDYNYANYDIEQAKRDYKRVYEELTNIQIALDHLNNSEKMMFELPDL